MTRWGSVLKSNILKYSLIPTMILRPQSIMVKSNFIFLHISVRFGLQLGVLNIDEILHFPIGQFSSAYVFLFKNNLQFVFV